MGEGMGYQWVCLFLNFSLCYVSALEADLNGGAFCGRKGIDFGTG